MEGDNNIMVITLVLEVLIKETQPLFKKIIDKFMYRYYIFFKVQINLMESFLSVFMQIVSNLLTRYLHENIELRLRYCST